MTNAPQQLSRPLASRVTLLPDVQETRLPDAPPTSEAVMQAAFDALDKGKTHYTDRPGILPLREKAVAHIGETYGVEMGADEVTITCGATEARFVTLKQLVKPGMKILCAGSGEPIAGAAALVGATLTHNTDDADIALAYLTPNDPADQVQTVLNAVEARENVWIVWDMGVQNPQSSLHPAQNPALAARTITIGSASDKLPGWRIGWLAGSKVANKLRAYKQSMTICTSSISQWAALGLTLGSETESQ